jgi:hypothetical protein
LSGKAERDRTLGRVVPTRLSLKEGVPPKQALDALRPYVQTAGNVLSTAGHLDNADLRNGYLKWVEGLEMHLATLTHDVAVITMLQSDRYWRIRELDGGTPRPFPLVQAEINLQKATLERFLDDLEQRVQRLSDAPGCLVVLDTNVLLHYVPPAQIPWPDVMGVAEVRLIVPLRVIEELDAKKYAQRSDLAGRARALLPQLEAALESGGAPGALRDGVTIEVPLDTGPRERPADADTEILNTCKEIQGLTGRPVALVTADTAMRIRAEAYGLRVERLPECHERTRNTGSK